MEITATDTTRPHFHNPAGTEGHASCEWPHVHPFGLDVAAAIAYYEQLSSSNNGSQTTQLSLEFRQRLYLLYKAADSDALMRELALSTLFVACAYTQPIENSALCALQQLTTEMIVQATYSDGDADWWFARFTRDSATRREWIRWWAWVPMNVAQRWVSILEADALDNVQQLQAGITSDSAMAMQVAAAPVRWTAALEVLRMVADANEMLAGCHFDFVARLHKTSSGAQPAGACADASCVGDSDRYAPRPAAAYVADVSSPRICACFDMHRHIIQWMHAMRPQRDGLDQAAEDEEEEEEEEEEGGDAWTKRNIFSLFLYPFLFSSDAKAELLWGEAFRGMVLRFRHARDRQAQIMWLKELLSVDTPEWRLLASNSSHVGDAINPYFLLDVRRDHIMHDAVDTLLLAANSSGTSPGGNRMRFVMKARFVLGGELGADMGGVQKELFALLLPELLAPSAGLFVFAEDAAATNYLWPNAASPHALAEFEAVGALVGLALYNRVPLDAATAPLAPLLLAQLVPSQRQRPDVARMPLSELLALVGGTFPDLASGLQQLLDWDEEEMGAIEDVFCRSFEVTVRDPLGVLGGSAASGGALSALLVDGGDSIPVTGANRRRYVRRHLQFVAFEHAQPQIDAIRRGFASVCDGIVPRMLGAADLVAMLSPSASAGAGDAIDVAQLERHATYEDGYYADHRAVRCFWRIVRALSPERRRRLLAFVTASERVPFGGYARLTFVVQRHGPDSDHLPAAITCFGRLLLPQYASEAKMRAKLLMAIENSSGFGLL
ncbi:hypothetical protein GGI23_001842 [Coemansia sp. RSA 2559]|nr:hypothetical protein GGI23_001842 [Coemansia sp. RSA 2559]KAJ2868626.1 hypothetical protein GGI22_000760 [Coemansia erecta]